MSDKIKTAELSDAELDSVTGGVIVAPNNSTHLPTTGPFTTTGPFAGPHTATKL